MARPVHICTRDVALGDSLVTLFSAHGIDAEAWAGRLSDVAIRPDMTFIVDLEMDAEHVYGDVHHLMLHPSRPRLILLSGTRDTFEPDDSFTRSNVKVLLPPIDPRYLVTLLQREPVST